MARAFGSDSLTRSPQWQFHACQEAFCKGTLCWLVIFISVNIVIDDIGHVIIAALVLMRVHDPAAHIHIHTGEHMHLDACAHACLHARARTCTQAHARARKHKHVYVPSAPPIYSTLNICVHCFRAFSVPLRMPYTCPSHMQKGRQMATRYGSEATFLPCGSLQLLDEGMREQTLRAGTRKRT